MKVFYKIPNTAIIMGVISLQGAIFCTKIILKIPVFSPQIGCYYIVKNEFISCYLIIFFCAKLV